ncbi:DNA-directed RNA polymerase I subunit rpa49 [Batrachochytrium dendrobatidis]|nr:DNA-directed RNA polymerase I subunit rpa49 [Batrachochytrium dendrobatidis]KAK5667394.1 DNA-directed RNA polymerase I subunit rpa49 [Batrachochytrium dendrobatidis]
MENKSYKLKAERGSASQVYLATFPTPPSNIDSLQFDIYGKPVSENDDTINRIATKKRRLAVAETAIMEYVGEPSTVNCNYIVGILDKASGVMSLHDASPLTMTSIVKSQKQISSKLIGEKNTAARNKLGQTFGSKKRKKNIQDLELNKVDVTGLENVASAITNKIQETSKVLPSREMITSTMFADRNIPPCHMDAETPDKVYRLEDLAPTQIMNTIDIKLVWKARLEEEIVKQVQGYKMTSWILKCLITTVQEQKHKSHAKLLVFVSMLMKLYCAKPFELSKGVLKLTNGNQIVADHVTSIFTEWQEDEAGNKRLCISNMLKDKLLAYILAITLHINNFTVNIDKFSSDLLISPLKATTIAKEMGCQIKAIRPVDSIRLTVKHAVLVLPLSFHTRRR